MGRKLKATEYCEMRNVVEGHRQGRASLKPEIIPGIMAWLLMLSKRYALAVDQSAHRAVTETVPGAAEFVERMAWAAEHLTWLARELPIRFSKRDYEEAAADVASVLGLAPGRVPGWDLEFEDAYRLYPEMHYAHDASGGSRVVQSSLAPPPIGVGGGTPELPGQPGGAVPTPAEGLERGPSGGDAGERERHPERGAAGRKGVRGRKGAPK